MVLPEFSWANLIRGLVVGGIFATGYAVLGTSKAQDESTFLTQLANGARNLASADPDATNVTTTNLINGKKVDQSRYSGTSIMGKWGGTLTVATTTMVSGTDGFTFAETVPSAQCEELAKLINNSLQTLSIGGTSVKSYGGTLTTSGASGVTTLCNATATPTMTFGWTVK